MHLFKKISSQLKNHFFKNKEQEIQDEMNAILSQASLAVDDAGLLNTREHYNTWKSSLLKTDVEKNEYNILFMDELFDYMGGMVNDTAQKALELDDKVENFKINSDNRVLELKRKSMLSFRCASLSVVALVNGQIKPEDKEEHLIMQQNKLNIALGNKWKGQSQVNYWYALHWFARGNIDNAKLFLKEYATSDKGIHQLASMSAQKNWISKKIPVEFHNISKEVVTEKLEAKEKRNQFKASMNK